MSSADRFTYSNKNNPCPICGRTKDGDCRFKAGLAICHIGSTHHPPAGIRPGSVVEGSDGISWAFTGDSDDGRAAIFTPDKPKENLRLIPNRSPVSMSFIARLPTLPEPQPEHLPDGHKLVYSETQYIVILRKDDKKRFIPHYISNDGTILKQAGPDHWPLWQQPDAMAHGPGQWIAESEGEGCAGILRSGGMVAVSQPGHDHKIESIQRRYATLKAANILGIVYLADNDKQGSDKAQKCSKAAKSVGLSFILLQASEIWPNLPNGGSIDDGPGTIFQRVSAFEQAAAAKAIALQSESSQDLERLSKKLLLALLRDQAKNGEYIRWNVFHQQVEINGEPIRGIERYYLTLADQGYDVKKDIAVDALVLVANEHPYDPVRLYLEHCVDTVAPDYIDRLATVYLRPNDASNKDSTLYDHMLRATLIAAVRRAMEPGCKHDTTCIIVGAQEARKSSFWKTLGGPFFSDSLGDLSSKDDLMKLHRSWIMEWAELDAITSRRHAGLIKKFLTQTEDVFRIPYGRAVEPNPRRGIVVGTANSTEGLLQDETGNRRFWVIPTTKNLTDPIDISSLAQERDAIWAAAVLAYREGASSDLPVELKHLLNQENESYLVASPWRAPIEAWLDAPVNAGRPLTSEVILTEAVGKPVDRQTRADQMQVSQIMTQLGYQKVRSIIDGRRKHVFSLL